MSDSNDSEAVESGAVDGKHANSLLILRLALGGFLFLWAIEKFIIPGKAIKLYKKFFLGAVDDITMTYVLGAVLTLMAVAFIIGAYKRWVYLYGFAIHAVVVWHYHGSARVYHDVIVQVSDDRDFISGVTTLYNNDHDNSSGLGLGRDKEYWDTYEGRLIDAKGVVGRYVRLYSNGSTADDQNHYTEVEVFGLPVK